MRRVIFSSLRVYTFFRSLANRSLRVPLCVCACQTLFVSESLHTRSAPSEKSIESRREQSLRFQENEINETPSARHFQKFRQASLARIVKPSSTHSRTRNNDFTVDRKYYYLFYTNATIYRMCVRISNETNSRDFSVEERVLSTLSTFSRRRRQRICHTRLHSMRIYICVRLYVYTCIYPHTRDMRTHARTHILIHIYTDAEPRTYRESRGSTVSRSFNTNSNTKRKQVGEKLSEYEPVNDR